MATRGGLTRIRESASSSSGYSSSAEQGRSSELEIGCAVGSFTEVLAPRCRELVAVDISENAVRIARGRLARYAHVSCERRTLPTEYPDGRFDLVIASDVFYYWTPEDVISTLNAVEQSLTPGGVFVAASYSVRICSFLTGHEVHVLLRKSTTLENDFSGSTEFGSGRPYLLDRFVRSAPEPRDVARVESIGAENRDDTPSR
jgi:SAM-dependent methyltransferase